MSGKRELYISMWSVADHVFLLLQGGGPDIRKSNTHKIPPPSPQARPNYFHSHSVIKGTIQLKEKRRKDTGKVVYRFGGMREACTFSLLFLVNSKYHSNRKQGTIDKTVLCEIVRLSIPATQAPDANGLTAFLADMSDADDLVALKSQLLHLLPDVVRDLNAQIPAYLGVVPNLCQSLGQNRLNDFINRGWNRTK